MKIWSDDKWVKDNDLTSSDGFQYGYGLFETILVKNNNASNLAQHLNRLKNSAYVLSGETVQIDEKSISASISKLPQGLCVLKILLYKDKLCFKTKIFHRPYLYSIDKLLSGFSLMKATIIKNKSNWLLQHKTTNYLENYLVRQQALKLGYNDAYFLNDAGVITECSSSNVFIKSGDVLMTSPQQEGLLPGIIRNKILQQQKILKHKIKEEKITSTMLEQAEGVFVCNSLIGLVGVNKIDNIIYQHDAEFCNETNKLIGFVI